MKTVSLTGTEKQVKFANDLMKDLYARIEKFESRGKAEGVAKDRELYDAIQDGANAGRVIEALQNKGHIFMGVERGSISLEGYLNNK